jgi:hypothetical protein
MSLSQSLVRHRRLVSSNHVDERVRFLEDVTPTLAPDCGDDKDALVTSTDPLAAANGYIIDSGTNRAYRPYLWQSRQIKPIFDEDGMDESWASSRLIGRACKLAATSGGTARLREMRRTRC